MIRLLYGLKTTNLQKFVKSAPKGGGGRGGGGGGSFVVQPVKTLKLEVSRHG